MDRLLKAYAVDILNPDAQILGGVTQWMRSAQLALAHGIPIAPHGDQEIHIHLAAAIPNGLIVEYYRHTNRLRNAMFVDPLELNDDGTLSPPQSPGLGVELDEEALVSFLMGRVDVEARRESRSATPRRDGLGCRPGSGRGRPRGRLGEPRAQRRSA